MHVHFVAVAGTGMGPLAGLLKAAGHDVSGSDTAFYPPMGPALERWGVRTVTGFDPGHLEPRPDLVVIGNVCRPTNPEARAAIDGGMRYASMPSALAELVLEGCAPLVVGGTHGKTTTSAMSAFVLDQAGLAPGFLIGGLPKNFDASFRAPGPRKLAVASGGGQRRKRPFVVEGDEYDTAFFEKTPKFWHYRPEVAIVTSIEHDHIDIYPDERSYRAAFDGFVARLPEHGLLVSAGHDRGVVEAARGARCETVFYCLSTDPIGDLPPHYMGAPTGVPGEMDVFVGGSLAGRVSLRVPGEHNLRNALAALAACCHGYGVELKTALTALSRFEGVRRRQDLLFVARGASVYDDFAHHPTAVRETLAALRAKHPTGDLIAVFEPRSATACRSLHQEEYAKSFDAATKVIFAPVGRPDIPASERLDLDRLVADLAARGVEAHVAPSIDAIVTTLADETRASDTIALLSNGAFGGIYTKLEAALSAHEVPSS